MFNGETNKLPTGIGGYKQSMRTTRGLQIARGSQHGVPKLVLVSDSYDAFWHRRTWIVNFETGLFYPRAWYVPWICTAIFSISSIDSRIPSIPGQLFSTAEISITVLKISSVYIYEFYFFSTIFEYSSRPMFIESLIKKSILILLRG